MPDLKNISAWIERLIFRVDRLESGAMLENASITSGRLRLIGGTLLVDSGGTVQIVGTLLVNGTTTVTGTFNMNGPWTLAGDGTITGSVTVMGPFTINGDLTINGTTKITGPTSIEGATTIKGATTIEGDTDITGDVDLTGDLNVVTTGRVKVGNMTLDPSASGGKLKFSGGPEVYATGGMLGLYSTGTGGWIELDGSGARLNFSTRSVKVTSTGIQLQALPTRTSANANNAPVGTVWSDTSGNLYRVVA